MQPIISCLLLSLEDEKIILPTAAIAEIIPYEEPEVLNDSPRWFKGILTWRGIHIPLINMQTIEPFSAWQEVETKEALENKPETYVAILNRIEKTPDSEVVGSTHAYPFFSILIKEIPKLYRLMEEGIKLVNRERPEDSRFLMKVMVQSNQAFIPNLQYFWKIIDGLPSRLQWFRQAGL